MRTHLLALSLVSSLSACATGGALDRSIDPTRGATTGVQLDFTARTDAVQPTFPAVVDPRLPSADRIAPRIRAFVGDNVTADVDLCVAPSGKVASVELARSSSYDAFDTAMMRDVATWQFASSHAPEALRSCDRFTISYHPHH